MPIDPERLLHFPIPEVRQRLTARDAVLYALSVGFGQDPMDARQLDYVDPARGLRVAPTMALVLGYPGFWLADPRTGVDATRLVHGEQEMELLRPLPAEGEVIGRTRVTGLVDKGAGRGALLYSERELIEAGSGATLAILRGVTFLRGDGGFGGTHGVARPALGAPEGEPEFAVDLPTRPEQALLYRLNGDDNPLHADPSRAAAAGFARPILHGLCTMGVIGHAILRALAEYDPARVRALSLRFSAPVFPGETIRTEFWPQGGFFRARVVERDVVVASHGRATIAEPAG